MNDDDIIYVDPLKDTEKNVTCVIKHIMIIALRFGHVFGTTITEVLDHTARRADKTVQWTHPEWPVICAMDRGVELPVQKPALYGQLSRTTKLMALAAGILGRSTSHAFRHGALRDSAYLEKTIAGVATAAVALVAHHADGTRASGITQKYVGALQVPIYNLRAESDFSDRASPKIAVAPFIPKRNTTNEVDAYIHKHSLDTSNQGHRAAARRNLQKEQIAAWEASERDRQASDELPTLQPSNRTFKVGGGKALIFPHAKKPGESVTSHLNTALSEKSASAINVSQARLVPTKFDGKRKVLHEDGADDFPIDPRLLNHDENLNNNNEDVDEDALEALESLLLVNQQEDTNNGAPSEPWETCDVEDALVQAHLEDMSSPLKEKSSPLSLDPDSYVSWFAAINISKNLACKNQDDFLKRTATGGSRDMATRFQFYCSIGTCQYSTWDPHKVDHHQVGCDGIDRAGARKYFSCPDCAQSYSTEDSLYHHIRSIHNFVPRPCVRCPDKPDVLYSSQKALNMHRRLEHEVFNEPTKCPLHDESCCSPEKLYTKIELMEAHLKNHHKQTAEQIREHIHSIHPDHRLPSVWDCPLGGCKRPFTGRKSAQLRDHLKHQHNKSDEECLQLVPLTKMEIVLRAARDESEPMEAYQWKCPVETCNSKTTFKSNFRRRRHLMNAHMWSEEKTMQHIPQSAKEKFYSEKKINDPGVTREIEKTKWNCPVEDCCTEGSFLTNSNRRKHLTNVHKWSDDRILQHIPLTEKEKAIREKKKTSIEATKEAKEKTKWKCPVEDCCSEGTFAANSHRREHLTHVHSWGDERALQHIPLSSREILIQEKKKRATEATSETNGVQQ